MYRSLGVFLFVLFVAVIVLPAVIVEGDAGGPRIEVQPGGVMLEVWNHKDGRVEKMALEKYLVGVLAAEMPAEFHGEALKAQAVAARTYALKRLTAPAEAAAGRGHEGHVCTDPTHCQGWLSDAEMFKRWGIVNYFRYRSKLVTAVEKTRGLVLTYNDRLAEPVYHSNAGGKTEAAGAVWGVALPYLRSVESPWDRKAPNYRNTVTLDLAEVERLLGTSLVALPASAGGEKQYSPIKIEDYTPTGRIKEVKVGGRVFSGAELRRLLGLDSTRLTWELRGDSLVITTIGKGHGVGMSQYGANGMAEEGYGFEDILSYYYPGTELARYEE